MLEFCHGRGRFRVCSHVPDLDNLRTIAISCVIYSSGQRGFKCLRGKSLILKTCTLTWRNWGVSLELESVNL